MPHQPIATVEQISLIQNLARISELGGLDQLVRIFQHIFKDDFRVAYLIGKADLFDFAQRPQ